MSNRARLPNRRRSTTFGFECNGLRYIATVSFFPSGSLAEVFINNAKAGSHSDSAAKDSAVVCSIACSTACRSKLSEARCCAMLTGAP
jgi:hypothetical protein